MVGVTVPIIPMAHQYLFTEPIDGVHPGLPQLRDPDNLVYFREEVGGLCMGGYERDPAPWSLDGVPADFNGKLLAPDMAALPADHGGRDPARPGDGGRGRQPGHQRPRGVHAGQRVHPRRDPRSAGSSWPPGSPPTASPAPAGSAARWRAGSSTASPSSTCGRWTSGASGPPIAARRTRWRARSRTTRPTTTSTTRTRSARPAGRCGRRRPTRSSPELGASFGEKSGWERPNWFESNAAAGDEALRPRGWAGEHWSPAIGAEALATRRAAGLFDETSFAKIEIAGRARSRSSSRCARNDVDVPVGRIVYTQLLEPARRDRVRPDRHPRRRPTGTCSSPARRWAPRPGVAAPAPAGRRDRAAQRRHLGPRVLRAVGPAGARHPRSAHARRRLRRGVPVPHRARDHRRFRAGLALRVTYVGELGWELYAPTEYGRALWRTLWEAGRPHGPGRRRLPRDRRAPAREGLPRLVERHHPGRDAVRGGPRVRGRARQGRRVHRPRRAGRGEGGRAAQAAALPRARRLRARSASATSRCGWAARSSAG